jgi:hypothetical protein
MTAMPQGDHQIGGIACKDGHLYWALGFPPFFTTPGSGVIWKVTYTGQ